MKPWEQFISIVDTHFKYLESEFGFKRISADAPFVVYESPFLRVSLYYETGGRHELDLGLEAIPPIGPHGRSVGISRLMQLHGGEVENYGDFYAPTLETLKSLVEKLAALLRQHGSAILKGDMADLLELQRRETEELKRLSREQSRQLPGS